ncbi:MAG: hypothetical protein E6559_00695 [Pantoea sp.]|uniref:hypothetical protein n=1 Tax=Pantoea septica TaxID=472695 RepID=UPI001C11DAC6|nr:hypothetical protein [Pantoea septica]MBU5378779.1 hypothetical protein [Pantoea septica]MDU5835585.1 hypothetical protein [Pantoea sp.]MDU6438429.1 hypothetical protein [Pantoea sp.]
MTYSTETVCALTGIDSTTLKRWYRSGFIHKSFVPCVWSDAQLQEVLLMREMTHNGATIRELKTAQHTASPLRTGGWAARRGDMLWQLEFGSERSLAILMRKFASNFAGDDFVSRLLIPLNQWLRDDMRAGACRRIARFHSLILAHAASVVRSATRDAGIPLLIENVSEKNQTEIWLEVIRLSGQGFSVDIQPADAFSSSAPSHHHHLLWCGAGLTELMYQHYMTRLDKGHPVMLCGPDRRLHHFYPQLPAVA